MGLYEESKKHGIPKFPARTKVNFDGSLTEPKAKIPNAAPPVPAPAKISTGDSKGGLVR